MRNARQSKLIGRYQTVPVGRPDPGGGQERMKLSWVTLDRINREEARADEPSLTVR